MDRRQLITATIAAGVVPAAAAAALAPLPQRPRIKVAFLLGDGANVIDTAGPWEVFQDASPTVDGRMTSPFELFTVAPTAEPVRMTGGLIVKPHHTIEDAPAPNVIVVPAQRSTEGSRAWLKTMAASADLTMSICTGAFQLGRVGLLDGLRATTHHDFYDSFARQFPKVTLERTPRFVDEGRIASAGGLTSGIDLALHVVARYWGQATADGTARYMEHQLTTRPA